MLVPFICATQSENNNITFLGSPIGRNINQYFCTLPLVKYHGRSLIEAWYYASHMLKSSCIEPLTKTITQLVRGNVPTVMGEWFLDELKKGELGKSKLKKQVSPTKPSSIPGS